VSRFINGISRRKEFREVGIDLEFVQREDAAPMTGENPEIVRLLNKTIKTNIVEDAKLFAALVA
jgi:hypothetical protein